MSLVELHRFATPIEAELARLNLEAEGIPAVLFDAGTFYVTGVRLMVDEDDRDEAQKLLALG
jgi:hypothetical protein